MTPPVYVSGDLSVGEGFTVDFQFDGSRLDCLWLPDVPKPETAHRLFPAYAEARNGFLLKLARATGQNMACVDLVDGSGVAHV